MKFLDILKQDLQNSKEKLILYDEIKVKSSKKYAVLTNEYFWIYSISGRKKKGRFLILLTGISYDESSTSLHFDQKVYQFIPKNLEVFLRTLFDIIQRILLPTELANLYFKVYKTFIVWPNSLSILSRIDQKIQIKKLKIDESFKNKFLKNLTFSKPILNLNKYPADFIPILCDSLPLSRTIREIIISNQGGINPFLLLSNSMKEPNRIRRIEIKGDLINFSTFISSLKSNQSNKLCTLSFDSSKMRESDLQLLIPLYANKVLKGIEFHSAFSKSLESSIYSYLSQFQLTILNLDGTKNLNINKLFPQLPEVLVLSLSNCEINVLNALQKLALLPKIRQINLSENFCDISISRFSTISSKLRRIEVNKVRWMEGSLISFFENIGHIQELSISYIDTEETEWTNLFSVLTSFNNFSLEELNWNGNKTNAEFFSFIKKCPGLISLSLNHIFSINDLSTFHLLLSFFDDCHKSFNKLCIEGNDKTFLGLESVRLIQTFKKNNILIDEFDINYQKGGDQLIYEICTIMSNFKKIICDGQNLIFAETINRLYRIATQEALPLSRGNFPIRNYPLNKVLVSFPYKDFQRVAKRENWTNEEKDRFLHDFMVLSSHPTSQPNDIMYQPIESKFDQPCMIYRVNPKIEYRFSRTLGKKEIVELSAPQPQLNIDTPRQRSSRKIAQNSISRFDLTNMIVHDEDEQYSKRITRSRNSKISFGNTTKHYSISAMKDPTLSQEKVINDDDQTMKRNNPPKKVVIQQPGMNSTEKSNVEHVSNEPPAIHQPPQISCSPRKRKGRATFNRKIDSLEKNNETAKAKRRESLKRRSKSPTHEDEDTKLTKSPEKIKTANRQSKDIDQTTTQKVQRSSKQFSKNLGPRRILPPNRNIVRRKPVGLKLTTSHQLRKINPPRIFNSEVSETEMGEKDKQESPKIKIIFSSSDSSSSFEPEIPMKQPLQLKTSNRISRQNLK